MEMSYKCYRNSSRAFLQVLTNHVSTKSENDRLVCGQRMCIYKTVYNEGSYIRFGACYEDTNTTI